MIDRRETRCVVLSCKFNHGEDGTVCDYALYGHPCGYTPHTCEWQERGAYYPHLIEDPDGDNGNGRGFHSLTARCDRARRVSEPMTVERARQLALEMELSEVER